MPTYLDSQTVSGTVERMMMRAALVISCLGFQGAALVAQAQGIAEDPRRRRAVLPLIRAATDCIAREALNEPNIATAAEQKQLRMVLAQPMRRCADELDAMVAMHDRVYFPGFGEAFFQGAYLDDLPRAVRQRIAPELARRATEADAARVAQERQDAQSRQAAQPQQQDKFALVETKQGFSVGEVMEEARRRVVAPDQHASADNSRAPAQPATTRTPAAAAPVAGDPTSPPGPQSAKADTADASSGGYGWWVFLGLIALGIYLRGAAKRRAEQRRRDDLLAKYGDASIVNRIMAGEMWQGMTASMLRDSWGSPVDVGRDVYKTRKSEVWKYGKTGRNRYKDRIKLENGIVVGFEHR